MGLQVGHSECQSLGAGQAACDWIRQLPLVEQHAAVGCGGGHSLGMQVSHALCQMLGAAQVASVVIVQVPASAQQAPCACGGSGHGFGPQIVVTPFQAPVWFTQAASVRMRHSPPGKQQAPAAGHGGVGGQAEPLPCQVPWQATAEITMQAPSWLQQAPAGIGQVIASQTPASVQVLGAAQLACVVTVQAPPSAQQEPFTPETVTFLSMRSGVIVSSPQGARLFVARATSVRSMAVTPAGASGRTRKVTLSTDPVPAAIPGQARRYTTSALSE